MNNKLILITIVAVLALVSCGSPYKYIGKSYAPTPQAEMFFREADVPEPFELMGKLEVELPDSKSTEKIQNKVMQIAATKGADAVLIDNFDFTTGGFTSGGVGAGKSGKKGGSVGVSTSKTKIDKNINIKATLLKYKSRIGSRSNNQGGDEGQ